MTAVPDDRFARLMEPVARKLLGDPNKHLSTATELRFGSHGSVSVDLAAGVWSDHEAKTGGGVMDLLARELRIEGQEAIEWLNREVGGEFEDRRGEARGGDNVRPLQRIVATYDYIDEHGELLFQVCRLDPKSFRQRRPDGQGWSWSVKGVRQVPYRLPELLEGIAAGVPIFVTEGEKDADALVREGLVATCNAGGAGKWPEGLAEPFRGADVVIIPDNDDAGHNHASIVGAALKDVARRVRILELKGLPAKGDVSDWLALGGDGPQLVTLAETTAADWRVAPPASRFGAIQWSDLDHVAVRQDWLVEGLMFCGDTGMTYGASGSGKSFLAVHMGLSIARGVPFLGHETRRGAVLYQAGEGGKGLVKRLKAYRQENRVTEDLPFVLLPARVDLFSAGGDLDAFVAECVAWKAALADPLALIVVDTFSTASPGANENASEDMSILIRAGESIAAATGAALMWVHHKNAAGDRERGHTSLRANIDTAIEVTKDEETGKRTARLAKLKDGEDGLKIGFELHPVTVGTYDDGKEITSCVVAPAQVEMDGTSTRTRLPVGQYNFLKVLDDAIRQWGGIVPVGGDAAMGTYGVEWPRFRDLYKAVCGAGKEPGAIRQALSHNGDKLWRDGLIGRHGEWLWITPRGEIRL